MHTFNFFKLIKKLFNFFKLIEEFFSMFKDFNKIEILGSRSCPRPRSRSGSRSDSDSDCDDKSGCTENINVRSNHMDKAPERSRTPRGWRQKASLKEKIQKDMDDLS